MALFNLKHHSRAYVSDKQKRKCGQIRDMARLPRSPHDYDLDSRKGNTANLKGRKERSC